MMPTNIKEAKLRSSRKPSVCRMSLFYTPPFFFRPFGADQIQFYLLPNSDLDLKRTTDVTATPHPPALNPCRC